MDQTIYFTTRSDKTTGNRLLTLHFQFALESQVSTNSITHRHRSNLPVDLMIF